LIERDVNKKKNNKIIFAIMFSGISDTIKGTLGEPAAQHMMPQIHPSGEVYQEIKSNSRILKNRDTTDISNQLIAGNYELMTGSMETLSIETNTDLSHGDYQSSSTNSRDRKQYDKSF
jgi:hypothetical protein